MLLQFTQNPTLFPYNNLYWIGSDSSWVTASLITLDATFKATFTIPANTNFKLIILTGINKTLPPTFPSTVPFATSTVTVWPSLSQALGSVNVFFVRWMHGGNLNATSALQSLDMSQFDPLPLPVLGPIFKDQRIALSQYNVNTQNIVVNPNASGVVFAGSSVWVNTFNWQGNPNTLTQIDRDTGAILGTTTINTNTWCVCFDGTNLWTVGDTHTMMVPIDTTVAPQQFAMHNSFANCFDGTYMWYTVSTDNQVYVLRPADGTILFKIAVGTNPTGIATDSQYVYVVNTTGQSVSKVTIAGNTPTVLAEKPLLTADATPVRATNAVGVIYDGGAYLWVLDKGTLNLIQMRTSDLACVNSFALPTGAIDLCFDGQSVWVLFGTGIIQFNTQTTQNQMHRIPSLVNPLSLTYDGQDIWIVDPPLLRRYIF